MKSVCRDFRERMTMAIPVLTLAVYLLSSSAAASSRVLVVHNNTDATLFVSIERPIAPEKGNYAYREEEVPPNTKKSLFNFLFYGRNKVIFRARYVKPLPKPIIRIFDATPQRVKTNVVEVFTRDFGRSVMFDNTGSSASQTPSLRKWVAESLGDPCEAHDIFLSEGSPNPEPARCNDSTKGMVAVCWDGNKVKNKYKKGAFCTYKDRDCETKGKKGVSPGWIYRCQ